MKNNLASHKITKNIIEKYGFKFTKSLGQNFLVDENILNKIIESSTINENDIVIEVGTGIGTLTYELCKHAKKVIAIEIDSRLIPILNETLVDFNNFTIINEDVLKVSIDELIETYKLNSENIKIIANLPYYITTPIIMKFLESKLNIEKIVVMIQKEVADRIVAKPSTKSYGSLSVAIQYYGNAKTVIKAPKSAFIPSPNVDSSVICIDINKYRDINICNQDIFFKTVKGGFSKRRKTIINSLSTYENFNKEIIAKALENSNIDPQRRGETLTINEYATLSNEINNLL